MSTRPHTDLNPTLAEQLLQRIPQVLTDDLLKPMYRKLPNRTKTTGHCYAASEALYHLLGGAKAGYIPQVARFVEDGVAMTHWWLKGPQGQILDPTAGQFTEVGQTPPYANGRGSGFLTRQPSQRAAAIIQRVQQELENAPPVPAADLPGIG